MSSLADLVRLGADRLAAAGVGSPRADAEQLLAHATGMEVGDLRRSALLGEHAADSAVTAYRGLLAQREGRVPLQHLTGEAAFHRVTLRVGPGVFVPRPETEVLVELALEDLRAAGPAPVVVDLCTGSGAVALAVATAWPPAQVHAVELSEEAHAWAAVNVAAHGPGVDLRLGDATSAFPELEGQVDVVTCNPPYIPAWAVPVDPEVRDHDPGLALYGGGEDGLEMPLALAGRAARLLRPGGVLLMEHADTQGQTLPQRLREAGAWSEVQDHPDLTGRPRVTRAVRA